MNTIEKKLYMVVGYKSNFMVPTRANVVIYGIYETMNQADQRQIEICEEDEVQSNAPYMMGKNGMISWVKILNMGDMSGVDIKQPS